MTVYTDAPEVHEIAERLIADVAEHDHLDGVELRALYRDKHAKSKGRIVYARARKVSGLQAVLAGAKDPQLGFFVLEVALDLWRTLHKRERIALIDHELSHCQVVYDDDDGRSLAIVGHDVEVFYGVLRRHGGWNGERDALPTIIDGTGHRLDITGYPHGGVQQLTLATLGLIPTGDELRREAADIVNRSDTGVTIDTDRL